MAIVLLMPSPSPRLSAGKASVMIAEELAKSMAPPTPWPIRIEINHKAPAVPWSQVTARRREKTVKTAKPRLKIFTRPNMSPTRPRDTSSTASTTMNPSSIQSR